MANQAKQDERAAREANKKYWGSETSVNKIAEALDLSKGRLYGLLVPLPTGESCPDCGEETGYANRTARDKNQPTCSTCVDGVGKASGAKASAKPAANSAQTTLKMRLPGSTRSQAMLGAVLLGVAAGLFFAANRRR